ncbi:MAG TPA: FAD/NAD(P)-binding protein [Kiritimatiellia bacterium]|nr:FAD/NAD(P)-binding protein [Kiritimatiellia bacterium]HRZ11556.1 FAD/NAD(P)-binding protein [Kiritimatiellia bacterium]HSA16893.1 FAD/NAD(P)-binding protein [Kiritimatiellia bacterium]
MSQILTAEKDIYLPEPADVVRAEPMTKMEMFFEFKLSSGRPLGHMPGQFAEVAIPGIGEAPISISSSPTYRSGFQMVVRNVGNVSAAMHRLAPGKKVGIRGPFGTQFPVDGAMKGQDLLFVCGGIGLVPVRSAIDYVLHHRKDYGRVTILFGTKSPAERLFVEEAKQWAAQPDTTFLETVDRGDEHWKGSVGVITTLMPKVKVDPARTVAVICGPPIMYKFVILELDKMGIGKDRIFVSLERHMKCGVGKCGHCQINGLYVCQDGPVFRYTDVAEVREAI